MRHDRKRHQDSDLPVTQKLQKVELISGDEGVQGRSEKFELEQLRERILASEDRSERESLLAEMQANYGNRAVSETISLLRDDGENTP